MFDLFDEQYQFRGGEDFDVGVELLATQLQHNYLGVYILVVGPPGIWDACNEPLYYEAARTAIIIFRRYELIPDSFSLGDQSGCFRLGVHAD